MNHYQAHNFYHTNTAESSSVQVRNQPFSNKSILIDSPFEWKKVAFKTRKIMGNVS